MKKTIENITKYLLSNKIWIVFIFLPYLFLYFLLAFISMPITEGYGGEITKLTETAYMTFKYIFFSNDFFYNIAVKFSIYIPFMFCTVLTTTVTTYLIIFSFIWIFKYAKKQ
jgi:hypothetical protein